MSLNTEGDKWIRDISKFDRDLVENMENMSNDELKQRVLQSQMNLMESERSRKDDDALNKAKAKFDVLKGPYDDAKKLQTAVINYGILLLEERGVNLLDEA